MSMTKGLRGEVEMKNDVTKNVQFCYVSQSISLEGEEVDHSLLAQLTPVKVTRNAVLKAIMKARIRWGKEPVIWAYGRPYKLIVLEDNPRYTVVIQVGMRVDRSQLARRDVMTPVNKRGVVILYGAS